MPVGGLRHSDDECDDDLVDADYDDKDEKYLYDDADENDDEQVDQL